MKRSAPHSHSIIPGTRNQLPRLNFSKRQKHFTFETTDECSRLAAIDEALLRGTGADNPRGMQRHEYREATHPSRATPAVNGDSHGVGSLQGRGKTAGFWSPRLCASKGSASAIGPIAPRG